MDTCFNYTTADTCYMSSDERRWINQIIKLAEEHPDEVHIIAYPEDNDGCIYATIPVRWLRVKPPRASTMTDEQKEIASQRLRAYRMSQTQG